MCRGINKCIAFFGDNSLEDERLRQVIDEVITGADVSGAVEPCVYAPVLVILLQVAAVGDPDKEGFLTFDKCVPAIVAHHIIQDYVATVPDRMAVS